MKEQSFWRHRTYKYVNSYKRDELTDCKIQSRRKFRKSIRVTIIWVRKLDNESPSSTLLSQTRVFYALQLEQTWLMFIQTRNKCFVRYTVSQLELHLEQSSVRRSEEKKNTIKPNLCKLLTRSVKKLNSKVSPV